MLFSSKIIFAFVCCSLIGSSSQAMSEEQSSQIKSYEELMLLPLETRATYIDGVEKLMVELEDIEIDKKQTRLPSSDPSATPGIPKLNIATGKVTCPGTLPGSSIKMIPYLFNPKKSKTLELALVQDPKNYLCSTPLWEYFSCPKGFVPGQARWLYTDTTKNNDKVQKSFRCFAENGFNKKSKATRDYIQRNVKEELAVAQAQKDYLNSRDQIAAKAKKRRAQLDKKAEGGSPLCTNESINAARAKFYRGAESLCIYGGNISQYKNGIKKTGNCQPPSQFCFESPNCENPATNGKWKPAYKCASDQVICNPLIFGIKEDQETPFCVHRESNATLQCAEQSSDAKGGLKALLLGDIQAGFSGAWNQFADQFNKLCSLDDSAADFFCRECQTIKSRMIALNTWSSNGKAKKFEKNGAKKAVGTK